MSPTWGLTARQSPLPITASSAHQPRPLPPRCFGAAGRNRLRHRRHGSLSTCSSAPQQWRTLPDHQYGTARRPAAVDDGGLPGPVVVVGWAVAAMVGFNCLRAAVLMWVRSQPRRQPRQQPAASAAPGGHHSDANVDRKAGDATGAAETVSDRPVRASASEASSMPAAASASTAGTAPVSPGASASAPVSSGAAALEDSSAAATSLSRPGGSLQIANYQLRTRGSRSNNNLGRVLICATLDSRSETGSEPGPGPRSGFRSRQPASAGLPWATVEWHQRFWEPLISKYATSPEDRVAGLLLLYGSSVLIVLEGDNNQLFALLRELRLDEVGVHRLQQIRVPCYILDLRERLFGTWMCAAARQPVSRGRALRAALRANPSAPNATAAAAAMGLAKGPGAGLGEGPLPLLPPNGEETLSGAPGAATPPDQQLVGRIQQLELFVKFVGPKLSALATQEARGQALSNLHDYETTTPKEDVVAGLATDPLAPMLHDFVTSFDADYHRYVSLLAMVSELETELTEAEAASGDRGDAAAAVAGRARIVARAASVAGEIQQLARFYDEHVKRDLKVALAQREEERRSRGADEVARRLSRGMRLRVGIDGDGTDMQSAAT